MKVDLLLITSAVVCIAFAAYVIYGWYVGDLDIIWCLAAIAIVSIKFLQLVLEYWIHSDKRFRRQSYNGPHEPHKHFDVRTFRPWG